MLQIQNTSFYKVSFKIKIGDSYDGDDSYYEYADDCKGGSFSEKVLANNTMSAHDKFMAKDIVPLKDHEKWKNANLCCIEHSYVFQDLCEVSRYKISW